MVDRNMGPLRPGMHPSGCGSAPNGAGSGHRRQGCSEGCGFCAAFGAEITGIPVGGMHPPFFFVLPKKNAPCTVEEKGAFVTFAPQRSDREPPQTLRWRLAGLLPGALNIVQI